MNHLLRPWIWPSFRASSGVPSTSLRTGGSCNVPFRYGNQYPAVARGHINLRGLATEIREISGLKQSRSWHEEYWSFHAFDVSSGNDNRHYCVDTKTY